MAISTPVIPAKAGIQAVEDAVYDYDFTIPGEQIGELRNLLHAGCDALGDSPEDLAAYKLGKFLLRGCS